MNKNLASITKNPYVGYILLGFALMFLPQMASMGLIKNSVVTSIGGVLFYGIAALGFNILLGYSGLISLGTAGFMGVGAYASAFFVENMGLPFFVSMILSVLIPVVIGLLVGLVSLRIEGIYLAIATLCVSEILRKTFEELAVVTNGFAGKNANYPILPLIGKLDRTGTYYLIVIILVLMIILTHNIVNGKIGRALNAMRGSEAAAQAMGVNLLKYRLIAFALSTAYASLAGVLYVHFIRGSYPTNWTLNLSLNILAIIVIGGMRSIYGTILGAFVVYAVPDLIIKQLPVIGDIPGVSYIFNGVLIILVILFYPNGVIGIFYDIKRLILKYSKKGGVKA